MTFGGFGGNFITEDIDDKPRSRAQAKQLHAGLHLVMSRFGDTSFAQELKQDNPEATIVFRPYNENDRRWQDFQTPEQIYDFHGRFSVGGLVVQVGNEGGLSANMDTKFAAVAAYFRQNNKRCAIPSWAVGNPPEGSIEAGQADAMIKVIAEDTRPLPNLFAVHEYAEDDTLLEQPYRIGRLIRTLDRARILARKGVIKQALDPGKMAVLEYGRDLGGNALTDGWRVRFGGDELKFFNFMKPGMALYVHLGILGAAVFAQSKLWPSFDWQTALKLIEYMAAWNAENVHLGGTVNYPAGTLPLTMRVRLTSGIRLRQQPSLEAATLRLLPINEVVTVFQKPVAEVDGYSWGRVQTQRNEAGWCALIVGGMSTFTGANVPQPPPTPIPDPTPTPVPVLKLALPVAVPGRISQHFGVNLTGIPDFYTRWGLDAHEAVDFGGKLGDAIYAAFAGQVKAINIPGRGGVVLDHAYGIHIKLTHTDANGQAWETDYCHLSAVTPGLKVGAMIRIGQIIGAMGKTGDANNQVHLHFMLRKAGATARGELQTLGDGRKVVYINDIVNPEPYLPI